MSSQQRFSHNRSALCAGQRILNFERANAIYCSTPVERHQAPGCYCHCPHLYTLHNIPSYPSTFRSLPRNPGPLGPNPLALGGKRRLVLLDC